METLFDAYLASPGTPLGDQDLSDNYRLYDVGFTGYGLSIDLGTAYDLPTYESFGDAINLLLVSEDARPCCELTLECEDRRLWHRSPCLRVLVLCLHWTQELSLALFPDHQCCRDPCTLTCCSWHSS